MPRGFLPRGCPTPALSSDPAVANLFARAGVGQPLTIRPLARYRRAWRHVPLEELPRQGKNASQNHDACARRVHAPLPAARTTRWLPSHPPLWLAGQRHTHRQSRARTRAAQRCPGPKPAHRHHHHTTVFRVSSLWCTDGHRRDLRARIHDSRTTAPLMSTVLHPLHEPRHAHHRRLGMALRLLSHHAVPRSPPLSTAQRFAADIDALSTLLIGSLPASPLHSATAEAQIPIAI